MNNGCIAQLARVADSKPAGCGFEPHYSRKNNEMKEEKNYSVLIAVGILIINTIIVFFGRIYFPDNFQPVTTSFFENYWVLTLGVCFVISMLLFFGMAAWYFGKELIDETKSLINYFKKIKL